MADNTINISPSLAAPWKDTRAEGYITYYTKTNWDNWNTAAKEIERLVKEKQISYEAAMKLYAEQIKAIRTDREMLERKLIDVQAKKADVLSRREEMKARMEEARLLRQQALETEKARRKAYVPGSSAGGGGGRVGGSVGKDAYDELLDEIPPSTRKGLDARLADISRGITSANLAQKFQALQTEYDNGNIASDALTRDMATYTLYKNSIAALEAAGKTSADAEIEVNALMRSMPSMGAQVIGAKKRMADKEAAADARYGRTSVGGRQTEYEIAKIGTGVADLTTTVDEYNTLEADLKKKLEDNAKVNIEKPVLEPVDMITAARKEYIKKFGGVPTGVTLELGGETLAKYSNLMPFEVTNAMDQVSAMFGRYVDAEIKAAKTAAGRDLTTDEVNAATEAGKRKARLVLFGQTYTPAEKSAVQGGLPPTAGSSSATPIPASAEGWASVGVNKPKTGNAVADEAAYQKAKEEWAKSQGIEIQTREGVLAAAQDRISRYNRDIPNPYAAAERAMATARDSGILPEVDAAMRGVNAPVDLSGVKFNAPPRTESEYERLFRERVMPPAATAESPNLGIGALLEAQRQRIEADDLRRRSLEGTRRAPAFEVKGEGALPPASIAAPSTGESMLGRKPISISELPPSMNKLDRAALGIPDSVGTPVGSEVLGGDMGAAQRKREDLKKALEDLKKKRELPPEQQEFLKEADKVGKPEEGASLEMRDKKAKTEAVLLGATKAAENPKAAARDITKDNLGKYIASVYDENKIKGDRAKPISDLTQTIISEYAGDSEKQKKAVALLTQLAYLDETKSKIKA